MTPRLGLLVGFLGLALAAGAQTPQQAPATKQPAKAKPKRVFTEDDLQSFRKPWDDYADQKQAAEQAAASSASKTEASQPAASRDSKAGMHIDEPESPKAIGRELAKWEDELKRNEKLADEARQEMAEATTPDRAELAKTKLEIYEQNIVDLKQRVTQTRAQLAEAQRKGKATPAAPAPPEAGASNPPPR